MDVLWSSSESNFGRVARYPALVHPELFQYGGWVDDRGLIAGTGGDFLFATASRLLSDRHIFLHIAYWRLGRKADFSPPFSTEVKNAWSYTFTPPYVFMA
jgi:hypothetical protein